MDNKEYPNMYGDGNLVDFESGIVTPSTTEFAQEKKEIPDEVLDEARKFVSNSFSPGDSGYQTAIRDYLKERGY